MVLHRSDRGWTEHQRSPCTYVPTDVFPAGIFTKPIPRKQFTRSGRSSYKHTRVEDPTQQQGGGTWTFSKEGKHFPGPPMNDGMEEDIISCSTIQIALEHKQTQLTVFTHISPLL